MLQLLLTFLSLILTPLLTYALLKLYFNRTIPEILNDVGASIGEQFGELFGEIFEKPTVKQAMSLMGKKSGEVRANAALRNKAADKLLEGYPSIGFVLDQLDLTPVEGLQLLKDPLIGPFIQGALQKGLKGLQNPSQRTEYGGKM